jgi:hypothetical protein
MTGADKVVCQAATVLLLFTLTTAPAAARLGDFGGGDMMTELSPMLDMMKTKMGTRRFDMMMQTLGPMMGRMMPNGGSGLRGEQPTRRGIGSSGIFSDMLGGRGGSDLMGMIPQLMRMANIASGPRRSHRRTR